MLYLAAHCKKGILANVRGPIGITSNGPLYKIIFMIRQIVSTLGIASMMTIVLCLTLTLITKRKVYIKRGSMCLFFLYTAALILDIIGSTGYIGTHLFCALLWLGNWRTTDPKLIRTV